MIGPLVDGLKHRESLDLASKLIASKEKSKVDLPDTTLSDLKLQQFPPKSGHHSSENLSIHFNFALHTAEEINHYKKVYKIKVRYVIHKEKNNKRKQTKSRKWGKYENEEINDNLDDVFINRTTVIE